MKNAYILFSKQRPKNNKTIMDSLTHFCREHCLTYRFPSDCDCRAITIEGYEYNINLQEQREESEPPYWMIYCSLKGKKNS